MRNKNSHYFTNLLLLVFYLTLCHGEQTKLGAVILTGESGHAVGFEMEAELLKKGYDVHLIQVKTNMRIYGNQNWEQSKIGKQLDGKHYEKLIFIVEGHGNETLAVNMSWKNIFDLIKILENKSNELFVHLQTCHSGDVVADWNPKLGQNVKIFSTLSCRGENGIVTSRKNTFTQLISGNWLHFPKVDIKQVNIQKFKTLKCDATYEELSNAADSRMCQLNKPCWKIHIHRGYNEKLYPWNLLPNKLVEQTEKLDGKETAFGNGKCKSAPETEFNKFREINMNVSPDKVMEVTSFGLDPIQSIKIMNIDANDATPTKIGPNELKKIKPYSTILWINSNEKCDTQNSCSPSNANIQFANMHRIKIGYHRGNKTIWLTDHGQEYSNYEWDQDYPDDPREKNFFEKYKTAIIVISVLAGIGVIAGICVCVYKAKKKRDSKNYNNYETQNNSKGYNISHATENNVRVENISDITQNI